ncbi:MAG: potassium channel protein [Ktedonobacteraceae bacterium]|nr:potassium channel protein [Ktedonobacteraceae bacterium]
MNAPASSRHLKIAVLLVLCITIAGTIGYMLVEHYSFIDALYMTVTMISTVGHVIRPLDEAGRLLTIFVIVFGVGSLLYTFGAGMEFMLEGHFSLAVRRYLMERKISALRNHYIICGFGRVGSQIAKDLVAAHKSFVVIDENENNVQACIQQGYLALPGDARRDDVLREAGVLHAQCVLVATDNDSNNISITLSARHLNRKLFIVARSNYNETEAKLKIAGADRILSPYTIGGHRMATLAVQPTVIEFFDAITRAGNLELAVQEVMLSPDSPLIGKTMAEAQNTLSNGLLIVALKKQSGLMIGARQETPVEAGDTAIVVGEPKLLAAFKQSHCCERIPGPVRTQGI